MIKKFNIFKNYTSEGVGDKYLSNRYIIAPEFSDFEHKYKSYKNIKNKEEIIFNDGKGFILIKNPKSLKNIGNGVRGVIDTNGNLYVEQKSIKTHDPILKTLLKLGLINKYDELWPRKIPVGFISVQRWEDDNLFLISESYYTLRPEDERDYSIKNFWGEIDKEKDVEPFFKEFLNKAKLKNPNINFEYIQI